MTIDKALEHAGDLQSFSIEVLEDIANEMPHYLWIEDNYQGDTGWPDEALELTPHRLIHCEECNWEAVEGWVGRRYKTSFPQGKKVACPHCQTKLTVKHISRGIKRIEDRLDVVFYRKSAIDPDVVVAIAAHCTRFFRKADEREPWNLPPSLDVKGVAVFDAGNRDAIRLKSYYFWEQVRKGVLMRTGYAWTQVKSMKKMTFGSEGFTWNAPRRVLLDDTLRQAVRGTPIGRAFDIGYVDEDGIRLLDMICRYPVTEYLHKHGLGEYITRKLLGTLPRNVINWNGKDMAGVLKLSKERLGQLKGKGIRLTVALAAVIQTVDKRKIRCGIETLEGVAVCVNGSSDPAGALRKMLERFEPGKARKLLKFIARNRRRTIWDLTDYWNMVEEAGGDLRDDAQAFPRDFTEAHDRIMLRVKTLRNSKKDSMIQTQLARLTALYGFEFGGLILRPAANAWEVIREGETLHHCVARYVDRYANGETVICVLRRAVDPDRPWRTVEISKKGELVQDRGYKNDWGDNMMDEHYRAALDLFWAAWRERKRGKGRKSA